MSHSFTYSDRHLRRHGPAGYAHAISYRPWLRDEFSYRCVYCLLREQWGLVRGTFAVDHFLPIALHPAAETNYNNLLYVCIGCNGVKSARLVPDPLQALVNSDVWVTEDGAIHARTPQAAEIIDVLGLDSDDMRSFRMLWLGIIALARLYDRPLFERLMCYPDDLPDLTRLSPPGGNARPEGLKQSCFERRKKGDLPTTY